MLKSRHYVAPTSPSTLKIRLLKIGRSTTDQDCAPLTGRLLRDVMRRMTTPTGPKPKPRRRRRNPEASAKVASPVQVLAQIRAIPQVPTATEKPLTPEEVARLKIHFRFLRDHRNVLKLRVNAAEDLLLNGVKEPVHRGLCQHLLAKVERSRVLTVSQTLPPTEATRLLAGVIRFAPEIGYVLRYLECVKVTATQEQAGAAVTEALKQIEYSELSAAQMRQLVALIVDVFAERDLPLFLFTLLNDRSFKAALDRSMDGFPDVLTGMMRPLRTLHGVVASSGGRQRGDRGRPNDTPSDPGALNAGVDLLLDVHPASLLGLPESIRRRLFRLGCETLGARQSPKVDTLQRIFASLSFAQPADRTAATILFVSTLLAANQESYARRIIDQTQDPNGASGTLTRWRQALDSPRVGPIALDAGRSKTDLPPPGRLYRGWHIPSQREVLVRFGNANDESAYAEQIGHWRRVLLPGVARIIAAGASVNERPYIAVELHGQPLHRVAKQLRPSDERQRLRWAVELCAIYYCLSLQGIVLPDATLNRINVDPDGRLLLVDLWSLQTVEPQVALAAHVEPVKDACRQLLATGAEGNASAGLLERISAATELTQVAAVIEGG